ncbi:hypothetical protein KL86PLE_100147 [uncultured Pleomorphomonas sp.]|uniref:Uncharacterized protein n=1 Tax=uncultured Pleomorphomonas sp. TaxID=442121 RepID=A0A212L1H3_9HYPH|nr:hypothetical protein KL86PLE_100147 [uncultured Pleomorphomonas sp.]
MSGESSISADCSLLPEAFLLREDGIFIIKHIYI